MHFPRRKATIRTSDPVTASDSEEASSNRVVEISIIAAIAIALGLPGRLSAVITYKDDLSGD
jgi:hypothetical protein